MARISDPKYHSNVFINCPFDSEYETLFRALVFSIHYCGFVPRCAKEFNDSGDVRIDKILRLITDSKFAIHDLSRVEPRFNMPLELGIFIGCRTFGAKMHRDKNYLIIEADSYRFKKFISDISGQDIESHQDTPEQLIPAVRNWLSSKRQSTIPSGSIVVEEYNQFKEVLPNLCAPHRWKVDELKFTEYSALVVAWLTLSQLSEN